MKRLTAVVPCFNEEEVLPMFYEEIMRVAESLQNEVEFEVLFVNDGSTDGTLQVIRKLRERDKRVKLVSFSRNFGKEAAMYAGLEHSSGDFVAILDADLQHPPKMLIEMYHGIVLEGFDSVAAKRVTRDGEPKIRSFFSRKFYDILCKLSKIEIVEGSVDYRLMTRQMVKAVLSMSERNRFTKGIFGWVGFHTKWIAYENVERAAGQTNCTSSNVIDIRTCFLWVFRISYYLYCNKNNHMGGSDKWLAILSMYYFDGKWDSIILHGYFGTVYGQNLY